MPVLRAPTPAPSAPSSSALPALVARAVRMAEAADQGADPRRTLAAWTALVTSVQAVAPEAMIPQGAGQGAGQPADPGTSGLYMSDVLLGARRTLPDRAVVALLRAADAMPPIGRDASGEIDEPDVHVMIDHLEELLRLARHQQGSPVVVHARVAQQLRRTQLRTVVARNAELRGDATPWVREEGNVLVLRALVATAELEPYHVRRWQGQADDLMARAEAQERVSPLTRARMGSSVLRQIDDGLQVQLFPPGESGPGAEPGHHAAGRPRAAPQPGVPARAFLLGLARRMDVSPVWLGELAVRDPIFYWHTLVERADAPELLPALCLQVLGHPRARAYIATMASAPFDGGGGREWLEVMLRGRPTADMPAAAVAQVAAQQRDVVLAMAPHVPAEGLRDWLTDGLGRHVPWTDRAVAQLLRELPRDSRLVVLAWKAAQARAPEGADHRHRAEGPGLTARAQTHGMPRRG